METVTLNSFASFTIPLAGVHKETGLIVRSDGYVLTSHGWNKGHNHKAKASKLVYRRVDTVSFLGCKKRDRNGKKRIRKMVQVLVAETFLKNPENKPTVDHIDRNPQNNDVFNLRFATYKEQSLNTSRHLNALSGEEAIQRKKIYKREYYLKNRSRLIAKSHERYLKIRRTQS